MVLVHPSGSNWIPGKHVWKQSLQCEKILEYHPDLVGFSAATSGFSDGYDLAARIKEKRENMKILTALS